MEVFWEQLGARLSGRALLAVVKAWREQGLKGVAPDGEAARDWTAEERQVVRAALRAGRSCAPGISGAGQVLVASDAGYPEGWFRLNRAPAMVWVSPGGALAAGVRRVAMIGARRASLGGRRFARELAAGLASAGIEVWSGLARGVDGECHRGALQCGRTVAVLGCGLDISYPPEHAGLSREIQARGCLVTEFPPGTPPRSAHFPQRNRLLAAAVDALVVVEAGERSGALGTVHAALSVGVPVLVAPGDPTLESARGSNRMLREGATPVLEARDVLEELGMDSAVSPGRASHDAGPECLRSGPRHLEALLTEPGVDLATLLEWELCGRVVRLPGDFYVSASGAPAGPENAHGSSSGKASP